MIHRAAPPSDHISSHKQPGKLWKRACVLLLIRLRDFCDCIVTDIVTPAWKISFSQRVSEQIHTLSTRVALNTLAESLFVIMED